VGLRWRLKSSFKSDMLINVTLRQEELFLMQVFLRCFNINFGGKRK